MQLRDNRGKTKLAVLLEYMLSGTWPFSGGLNYREALASTSLTHKQPAQTLAPLRCVQNAVKHFKGKLPACGDQQKELGTTHHQSPPFSIRGRPADASAGAAEPHSPTQGSSHNRRACRGPDPSLCGWQPFSKPDTDASPHSPD